jgi:excisionase family DNA binding protein
MSNDDLQLLKTTEVASLLSVRPWYVTAHATKKEPRIKSIWLGRLRRFRRSDINEFIEQMRDDRQSDATTTAKPKRK